MATGLGLRMVYFGFNVPRKLDTIRVVDHKRCRAKRRSADALTVSAMAYGGEIDGAHNAP